MKIDGLEIRPVGGVLLVTLPEPPADAETHDSGELVLILDPDAAGDQGDDYGFLH